LIFVCFCNVIGDAALGGGKQQKKNGAAGEGKNRRPLVDIGNVVTLKGVEVKPNRPVTRSFCAQLLANAQAAAVAENNKVSDDYLINLSFLSLFNLIFLCDDYFLRLVFCVLI